MNIGEAINKILDSKNLCAKTGNDVNKGQYVIYKGDDCPLMFARRKDNIIYPESQFYKRIKNIDFKIEEVDEIDEEYIYEDCFKLKYKIDKFVEKILNPTHMIRRYFAKYHKKFN